MNEIEEKYARFLINENMREKFGRSAIRINYSHNKVKPIITKTTITDCKGKLFLSEEKVHDELV